MICLFSKSNSNSLSLSLLKSNSDIRNRMWQLMEYHRGDELKATRSDQGRRQKFRVQRQGPLCCVNLVIEKQKNVLNPGRAIAGAPWCLFPAPLLGGPGSDPHFLCQLESRSGFFHNYYRSNADAHSMF